MVNRRGEHGKKQHGGRDQCLLRSTSPLYKTSVSVFAGVSRRRRPLAESDLPANRNRQPRPQLNLIPDSAFKIGETPSRDSDDTDRRDRDPRATASLRLHACVRCYGAGSPTHRSPALRQNSVGVRYQATVHEGAPHRALCDLRLATCDL